MFICSLFLVSWCQVTLDCWFGLVVWGLSEKKAVSFLARSGAMQRAASDLVPVLLGAGLGAVAWGRGDFDGRSPFFRQHMFRLLWWVWLKNPVPKRNPGKWKHGPKPAYP